MSSGWYSYLFLKSNQKVKKERKWYKITPIQILKVNKLKFLDEQRVCDEAVNVTRRHGLE